jgi:hypothetical protein
MWVLFKLNFLQAAFLPPPCPDLDLVAPDFLEPVEMLRTEPPLFFFALPLELAALRRFELLWDRVLEAAVFLPLELFCAVTLPELRELLLVVVLRFALRA